MTAKQETAQVSTLRDRYGYLPFPLPHILEAEGEDFMFEVVERLGGQTVRIPLYGAPAEHTTIVVALGADKARRLAAVLGQQLGLIRVTVPTMRATQTRAAEVRMVHERAAGITVATIAKREDMTERAVYKALARARRAGITPKTPMVRDPKKVIPLRKAPL